MSDGILETLAVEAAFRPAMLLDELADLHIPFSQLGFRVDPEAQLIEAFAQHSGLSLLIGAPGHGKSSVLAHVADRLSQLPTHEGRYYLPLFVPVAARGEDALDVTTFGAMAIGNLLAAFDDLSEEQARAFAEATAEQITREGPNRTFNARLAAKVFGTGVEGGVESKGEVITVTARPRPLDEFGGLSTLAHTLRGRDRELVVIVEDTDGWTVGSEDEGRPLARGFFGKVLAPLATAEVSIAVAVQTRWTDLDAFDALNERALKRIALPAFDSEERAAAAIRRVIVGRMEWKLGGRRDAADAVTDAAVAALASDLRRHGSMRTVLTRLRDTLDQLHGRYPERIDTEHLVESA